MLMDRGTAPYETSGRRPALPWSRAPTPAGLSPMRSGDSTDNAHSLVGARAHAPRPVAFLVFLMLGISILLGYLIGSGLVARHLVVMSIAMVIAAYLLGWRAKSDVETWLPGLMALAMMAKLAGASVRYYVLIELYDGSGDAGRYHTFAVEIAETWRNLQVPDVTTVAFGSAGTRFTAWVTGLLYAPYQPSFQGGFWIFALLAFIGQLFLYLAFRKAVRSQTWKRFAFFLFFWPTLVYWPSSIGKEALIMLFLGIGCWAAANLFQDYRLRWLPLVGASAYLISLVRVHMAALLVGSLLLTVVLAKSRGKFDTPLRRVVILLIGASALVPLAFGVGEKFDLDVAALSADNLDPLFAEVGDTTQQGGSSVSGGVIRSPLDIPAGVLKVLFRPLPVEADSLQMLASSAEGALLLGLLVWRFPHVLRNVRQIRRTPFLLFCFLYSGLFIWAWSAILNLGILARQRSLVIPFVLALIAVLGWTEEDDVAQPNGIENVGTKMSGRQPSLQT